jgi:hypothetical protein
MSVLTRPEHMRLTFTLPRIAWDTFAVSVCRATLEMASTAGSWPSPNDPPPDETLTTRP